MIGGLLRPCPWGEVAIVCDETVRGGHMWYQFFKYTLFAPGTRLVCRPWVVGEENIPTDGGAILASNHLGVLDPLIVASMIDRPITYPAKKELFDPSGGPGKRIVAWFMHAVDQVPLDRSGGRGSLTAMDPVLERLQEGGLVGIFPEGTRSADDRMFKAKTGVARLALTAKVPVIPVGVAGSQTSRTVCGIPLCSRPGLIFGKPLDFSDYSDRVGETAVLRWVTNEIMDAVAELTGQEYVDVFATRVKYGNLRGKDLTPWVRDRPGHVAPPAPRKDRQRVTSETQPGTDGTSSTASQPPSVLTDLH